MPRATAPQLARPKAAPVRTPGYLRGVRSLNASLLSPAAFALRHSASIAQRQASRQPIALLIAAYNEELVIAHTIRSAIAAGLASEHIYVVDDCSSDRTSAIARSLVGPHNVLRVGRSGKGLAIQTAAQAMLLTRRYRWIHIADADGGFDSRYFTVLRRDLRVKYAAATGYVTSLPGSLIGQYRVYEYTMGMEVIRRFQALARVITIIPGPTSLFRSDVFERLQFNGHALCEDMDVTLQVHRKRLGSIQFIPEAIARTQDPVTFKDFTRQITRWNRGVMQMLFRHRIGRHAQTVDAYLLYQVMQNLFFFLSYTVLVPSLAVSRGEPAYVAVAFLADVLVTAAFVLFAAQRAKRWDIIGAFPLIYGLRWVSLGVFLRAFVEVAMLRKFRVSTGTWETATRTAQA